MKKPTLFIASTEEGYPLAEEAARQLAGAAEVSLWKDTYEWNRSSLDSLLLSADRFDFALIILTNDDTIRSRGMVLQSPRDNLLFEFGLFLGRLGLRKTFAIAATNGKLLSDLEGITIPKIELPPSEPVARRLEKPCREVANGIREQANRYEFGLLPSTALAVGYFNNLLRPVCEELQLRESIEVDGQSYADFHFTVLVPDSLHFDVEALVKRHGLVPHQVSVRGRKRPYPVYRKKMPAPGPQLELYDVPTTLLTAGEVIRQYVHQPFVGKSASSERLAQRELESFAGCLRSLVAQTQYQITISTDL